MNVYQSALFAKQIKKFSKQQKQFLDHEIRRIIQNPTIGSEKKGDLKNVFVYKFKILSTEFLLSYRFQKSDFELITIGPHENYYRDLKNYLKKR